MKYLVALAALSASTVAFASDDPFSDIVDEEPANVQYEQRQVVDFEKGIDLTGTIQGPSGKVVIVRDPARFNPLIKLRANFTPEMRASIEEVK